MALCDSLLYLLPPSTTIHSILPVQSPAPLWSTSIWHPPLYSPYISSPNHCSFCNTCPYHCHLSCCSTEIVSSNTHLSPNSLLFFLNITHPSDHSHLCPLKCHLIFFYWPSLTFMQHTTVHTTAVQSPSHYR